MMTIHGILILGHAIPHKPKCEECSIETNAEHSWCHGTKTTKHQQWTSDQLAQTYYYYYYGTPLRFARTREERPGNPRWRRRWWWWWWWWMLNIINMFDIINIIMIINTTSLISSWNPVRNPNDCMVTCSMGPGVLISCLKPFKKP